MTTKQIYVPALFWEDHFERCPCDGDPDLAMAREIRRAGRRMLMGNAEQIECPRSDAAFYCDGYGPDEAPANIVRSARDKLKAIARANNPSDTLIAMSKLDLFAETNFGKAAWRKLGNVPENFRLYRAAWLGKRPKDWKEMRVTGREFRAGKHGDLDIPVPNTIPSDVVTREEMQPEG